MRPIAAWLLSIAVLLAGCGRREPQVQKTLLVSPAWLAQNLEDPDLVLLHVGVDSADYLDQHIPGARFLHEPRIAVERNGLTNQLPSVAELDTVYRRAGVGDSSRVVVYGAPLEAARAFVTLDVLGLGDRTALLDGGLQVWRAEGRPTMGSESVPGPAAPTTGAIPEVEPYPSVPHPEWVVDAAWVEAHRTLPHIVLLDARPPAQFSGRVAGKGVVRPGHIPGAHDLFWELTIESLRRPTLRPPDTLREMFKAAGVQPGDTVVTYCRTGMESSFLYFVARYLGYPARLYDGSFLDWSRRPELPVIRSDTGGSAVRSAAGG